MESALDKAYAEIDIMRHLYHRHVVLLFEVWSFPIYISLLIPSWRPQKESFLLSHLHFSCFGCSCCAAEFQMMDSEESEKMYLVLELLDGGKTLEFDEGAM